MGSLFEEDDDFDLAAIEARHAEMEAEALLDKLDAGAAPGDAEKDREETDGIFPESDWEAIVEAVLFTMGISVELRQLAVAIDQSEKVTRRIVENLQKRYELENRGMQIIALEDSYQMSTRARFYENLIRVAATPKKHVLTDVVLETLSIIAYKQPVTKMEISKIRGVSSDHAVNRLVEYGLIYEVGRLDAPGRPALFATTEEFLRRFGVGSATDLPTMNPEQEEEIIQEVEEELQMKLNEVPEEGEEVSEGEMPAVEELAEEAAASAETVVALEEAAASEETETPAAGTAGKRQETDEDERSSRDAEDQD